MWSGILTTELRYFFVNGEENLVVRQHLCL